MNTISYILYVYFWPTLHYVLLANTKANLITVVAFCNSCQVINNNIKLCEDWIKWNDHPREMEWSSKRNGMVIQEKWNGRPREME